MVASLPWRGDNREHYGSTKDLGEEGAPILAVRCYACNTKVPSSLARRSLVSSLMVTIYLYLVARSELSLMILETRSDSLTDSASPTDLLTYPIDP